MSDRDDADRIRRLFDDVMADSPPAPGLAEIRDGRGAGGDFATRRDQRRAWAAAGAVGLVATSVLALVVLPNRGGDAVRTLQDTSLVETAPAVTTPSPATTDGMSTVPGTATSPAPSTEAPPVEPAPSVDPAPSGPVDAPDASPPLPGTEPVVVIASEAGVFLSRPEGDPVRIVDTAATAAFAASDGRVFALTRSTSDPTSPAIVVVWDPSTRTVRDVELPDRQDGELDLFDVATIDGQVTILYETGPAVCDVAADECDRSLRSFQPDTGLSTGLVTLVLGRSEWVSVGLTDTGLVVGEVALSDGTRFYGGLGLDAELGRALPTEADLGLAFSLPDCTNCPRAYTADPQGRHVAWRQGPDVVIVDLDEPSRRVVASDVVPQDGTDVGSGDVVLDVDGIELDGDEVVSGLASFVFPDSRSVVVDLSDGRVLGEFSGRATLA